MKQNLLSLLALLCLALPASAQQQLAFPGADGYGRYATGGRGGDVFYVTRLDDCPDNALVPGTLRWALNHDNGGRPRTVLFNVAGTIYLTGTKLKVKDNTSLLGQTAPGGGVCVAGVPMYICGKNIIVRYMRFRAGDVENKSYTGLDMENASDVILDHCSMTWSMEECLTAYDTKRTTVQWCIIGEGLYNSKNAKGARAYATQWGGEHSTMHHTLITNSHSRAPRFNGVRSPSNSKGEHDYKVDSEYANNVVFNWSGSGNQYGGEYDKQKVEVAAWTKADPGYDRVYAINNYYRPGPATKLNTTGGRYWVAPSAPYGEWYVSGNKFEVDGTFSPKAGAWAKAETEKVNADNLYGTSGSGSAGRGINLTGADAEKYIMKTMPYALSGLVYEPAEEAYKKVVSTAGASLPRYDEVDSRLLAEARGDKAPQFHGPTIPAEKGIIDSPDNVTLREHDTYEAYGKLYTNYPFLGLRSGDKYAVDTDGDGLPDAYETAKGLNPADKADGAADSGNGYTNLEVYLNAIADGTVSKSDYETSAVAPGAAASVTLTIGTQTLTGNPIALPATIGANTYAGYMGGGQYYAAGQQYTFPSDMTLTPVCEVTFADTGLAAIQALAGGEITLPSTEKDGYTFDGWTDGTQTYAAGSRLAVAANVALTPLFTKVQGPSGSGEAIVTWPLNGTFEKKATQEPEGIFATTTVTLGTALTPSSKTLNKVGYAGVQPAEQIAAPNADNTIAFTITPVAGMRFRPTKVTLLACRFGTDGGLLDFATQQGAAAESKRLEGYKPVRDRDDDDRTVTLNIADAELSADPFTLRIYLYSLGNTKQVGFHNLVISGVWEGTAAEPEQPSQPKYADQFTDCAPYNAVVATVEGLKTALANAAATTRADEGQRYAIFLRNGTYDLGSAAKTAVPGNTTLVGESREGVIIENCPTAVSKPADDTPTLFIDQNSCRASPCARPATGMAKPPQDRPWPSASAASAPYIRMWLCRACRTPTI